MSKYSNNRFVVSERIFAPRLAHGPLDRWERLYRQFLSCEFWELLDVDPWLKTAGPSVRGQQILVPLIRRVLDDRDELPVNMVDWVKLYQRLTKIVLDYFDAWSERCSFAGDSKPRQERYLRVVGE